MRLVIQRVQNAAVIIEGKEHSKIGAGLMVLAGFCETDTHTTADWMASKLVQMRIFSDENGKMNHGLKETNGDLLIVSQFTLYADVRKGNRPSFIKAAKPETAIPLYHYFIEKCGSLLGKPVLSGVFGADMKIDLINDGPVTILIDSDNLD